MMLSGRSMTMVSHQTLDSATLVIHFYEKSQDGISKKDWPEKGLEEQGQETEVIATMGTRGRLRRTGPLNLGRVLYLARLEGRRGLRRRRVGQLGLAWALSVRMATQ